MKLNKVLVHGNFEILHTGHIRLFLYAKEISEKLIVGLCTSGLESEEIRRRLDTLESNPIIDEVVCYFQIEELIGKIRPNAVIKGREFIGVENPEELLLASYGGQLIFSSGDSSVLQSDVSPSLFSKTLITKESTENFLRRNQISLDMLAHTLNTFETKRILVVGDVILDEYVDCVPVGLSQESSTLVAQPLSSKRYLGGAGIIAAHCSSLGAQTTLLTVLGTDSESEIVRTFCNDYKTTLREVRDSNSPTILKQRFVHGKQMLFRLNRFQAQGFSRNIRDELKSQFYNLVEGFDAVIFADFSYGVLNLEDIGDMVIRAKSLGVFVAADSQSSSQIGNLLKFKGANLICPTEHEARIEIRSQDGLIVLSHKLLKLVQSDCIFLKLGADGVIVSGLKFKTDHISAMNENPVDVAGAGDSLIAASTLAFSTGASPYVAAFIGSLAAAIQVSRPGNQPISRSNIATLLDQLN